MFLLNITLKNFGGDRDNIMGIEEVKSE